MLTADRKARTSEGAALDAPEDWELNRLSPHSDAATGVFCGGGHVRRGTADTPRSKGLVACGLIACISFGRPWPQLLDELSPVQTPANAG